MNHPNIPCAPDAATLHGFESIEALLRVDAARDQTIQDEGFTARVMARLPVQHAESAWRWVLPHLIVALGVMAVLLAGIVIRGLGPHLLTGGGATQLVPWSSLVVGAAVSMGVFFSLDAPWPSEPVAPVRSQHEHSSGESL